MNEPIAPIIALIALGLLLLWGITQRTLFRMHNAKDSQRKNRDSNFTDMPDASAFTLEQTQSAQAVKKRTQARRVAAIPVGGPFSHPEPEGLTEETFEATPEPPTSSMEVEPPPQATKTRNFRGQDLRGLRLRGENLAGADLSYCNLVRANLADTDLHGANLAYADLTNANLIGANLSGCDCTGTRFHGANLGGANLRDSDLTHTRFGPSKRPWAEVYSLRGDSRFPWRVVEIVGANVGGVNLQGANCTGSDILCGVHDNSLYWTQW